MLADMLGENDGGRAVPRRWPRTWPTSGQQMADDGDHYRLAFDKPGTWSQKYNLVWDKLLGLNLFPPESRSKEMAFYLTKQNTYGLPLDNRKDYTKLDWIVWTATLAEAGLGFRGPGRAGPSLLNESPTRVP